MPKSNTTTAREQKLASKLRENLRRRKAQANLRQANLRQANLHQENLHQENLHKDAKNQKAASGQHQEPDSSDSE